MIAILKRTGRDSRGRWTRSATAASCECVFHCSIPCHCGRRGRIAQQTPATARASALTEQPRRWRFSELPGRRYSILNFEGCCFGPLRCELHAPRPALSIEQIAPVVLVACESLCGAKKSKKRGVRGCVKAQWFSIISHAVLRRKNCHGLRAIGLGAFIPEVEAGLDQHENSAFKLHVAGLSRIHPPAAPQGRLEELAKSLQFKTVAFCSVWGLHTVTTHTDREALRLP